MPDTKRSPRHGSEGPAETLSNANVSTAWHVEAEIGLREAGRKLEVIGVGDLESARLARVVFRLAHRVAVDAGRLERAA